MSKIAFFDFDGTITTKDTLLEFIKFTNGKLGFYKGFFLHLPALLAYKAGIISNQSAKEKILRYYYKNTTVLEFNQMGENFSRVVIPNLIRPGALEEVKSLKSQGFTVVIVSASPENWITPWASKLGITVIATQLKEEKGEITGEINGSNCYGDEKVRRIREIYDLSKYETLHCYGDTSGDLPMLTLASKSFYKPFR